MPYTPEEEIELARSKSDAVERLREAVVSSVSTEGVRLRAVRGLVELGRVDQLARALGALPREEAASLVGRSVRNLTWLAMAGSVPDRLLRKVQVHAKDALLLLDEWMTPGARREAREVVVRWFVADLATRSKAGDVPLARVDPAVRSAVCAAASLSGAKTWNELPEIAAIVAGCGNEIDLGRIRSEAVAIYVAAPYGTPRERGEAQSGAMAVLKALRADMAMTIEPLAAVVRSRAETVGRRVEQVVKLRELSLPLGSLGLGPIVADESEPPALRAAVAGLLAEHGDGSAAAAAVLAVEPEIFEAVRDELAHVKIAGGIPDFAEAVAARSDRLAVIPGRCEAVADALSSMGPRRSASAAVLLLRSANSVIMGLGIEVLGRVGTSEHRALIEVLVGSRVVSACAPDETLGAAAARALEKMASRGGAGPTPAPGDDDGREP